MCIRWAGTQCTHHAPYIMILKTTFTPKNLCKLNYHFLALYDIVPFELLHSSSIIFFYMLDFSHLIFSWTSTVVKNELCESNKQSIKYLRLLIDIQLAFIHIFVRTFSASVVVIKTSIFPLQFLDISIFWPSINLKATMFQA